MIKEKIETQDESPKTWTRRKNTIVLCKTNSKSIFSLDH